MTALRLAGLWLSPALLLVVSAHLYAGGLTGLVLALLMVLAPSVVLLEPPESAHDGSLFIVLLTLLVAVLLLSANLLVIGDIASGLGAPRWHGIAIAAGCALAATVWPPADRWWPWLTPCALGLVVLALVVVACASGVGPTTAWSEVASRPDFRFAPRSPWVVSGGTFPTAGSLTFTELHTLRALDARAFGVIVSDGPAPSAQEWRPAPGDTVTLRAGDRLVYSAGARLAFEPGRRVPGAPRSGPAWADAARDASPVAHVLSVIGLGVTFAVGAVPLLRPWRPATRAGAAVGLGLLLAAVAWAEGWAVYAARLAPDFYLTPARAGALVRLPAFALDPAWGRRLGGLVVIALFALFVASASALRGRIAALDRGGGELGRDVALWAGVFGVAVVWSLWPRDPWTVLVLAFGVLASSLGPVALAGVPSSSRAAELACAAGLAAFTLVTIVGQLATVSGAVTRYPALYGCGAAWMTLALARPRPA